jgi:hypothetical protein
MFALLYTNSTWLHFTLFENCAFDILHVIDFERHVIGIAKLERQGQTTRPCRSLASVRLNNLR